LKVGVERTKHCWFIIIANIETLGGK